MARFTAASISGSERSTRLRKWNSLVPIIEGDEARGCNERAMQRALCNCNTVALQLVTRIRFPFSWKTSGFKLVSIQL